MFVHSEKNIFCQMVLSILFICNFTYEKYSYRREQDIVSSLFCASSIQPIHINTFPHEGKKNPDCRIIGLSLLALMFCECSAIYRELLTIFK